jgi:hypothetical protein
MLYSIVVIHPICMSNLAKCTPEATMLMKKGRQWKVDRLICAGLGNFKCPLHLSRRFVSPRLHLIYCMLTLDLSRSAE